MKKGHCVDLVIHWPSFLGELSNNMRPSQFIRDFLDYIPGHGLVNPVADRWLLVSNLHKAIRYGLVDQAARTAEALFLLDSVYFFRRLPVIALEDVSLGNLPVCAEVLAFCRDPPLRSKFQSMELAGYLGARLAATHKSRSACDLLSLVAAQKGHAALESEIGGMSIRAALDTAVSLDAPLRMRAVAFLRLNRLPIRSGDSRAVALRRVSEQLQLPAVIGDVLVHGNSTYGLNALLPLIFELMAHRPLRIEPIEVTKVAEVFEGPLLCSAFDQHTRLGREAMKHWLRATPALSIALAPCGVVGGADKIIGMALFHVEGSLLNRRLTNDCLELLRDETERAEMAALGLGSDDAAELYALMRRNLPALNEIRGRLWKK